MSKARNTLPDKYQPFLAQAHTSEEIRYGSQRSALQSILNQTTQDYHRSVAAQKTANLGLLGALSQQPGQLAQVYEQAGLGPSVLQAQAGNPSYGRIASELASAQAGAIQQQASARAGGQYQLNHLHDTYQGDLGKITDQALALNREAGLYESDLLGQLIGEDTKARADARQHRADQRFEARQNALGDKNSLTRGIVSGLISQGVTPVFGKDGTVSAGAPIPGAKSSRPKPGPKATPHDQSMAESDFGSAVQNALQMAKGGADLGSITRALTQGRPAVRGEKPQPVFDPATGKKKIDPKTGVAVTTGGTPDRPAVKGIDAAIAQAAAEQGAKGYVTSKTIKHLHHLGYSVRDFPGLVTELQHHRGQRTNQYAPGAKNNLH